MQKATFALLLVVCLTVPSNWTQDIPVRYARRHPGMIPTWPYAAIDTAAYRR
jgi:hypothetical protein